MAKVLIRNLDERTVAKLKKRAARNDRSLQAELHAAHIGWIENEL